jgi:hypothetical protein
LSLNRNRAEQLPVLARFLATWPETREVSQRVQHAVIASHRSPQFSVGSFARPDQPVRTASG